MIAEGVTAYNPQTGQTAVFTQGKWAIQGSPQSPMRPSDEDAVKKLQDDAQTAQFLDQKAQQFIQTMNPQKSGQGSFATGPIYGGGIPIPFAHGAEIGNPVPTAVGAVDPRMGALESITDQSWIHMRPQGSGAVRGYEAGDFKAAFPGVQHWGPENQQIADRLHQDHMIAAQKLDFIDNFIRSGKGTYPDAVAAWAQGAGVGGGPPQGSPQGPQQGAAPQAPSAPQQPGPPMQMTPDQNSPIGAVPTPGAPIPAQLTPQQTQILQWTPDGGLQRAPPPAPQPGPPQ